MQACMKSFRCKEEFGSSARMRLFAPRVKTAVHVLSIRACAFIAKFPYMHMCAYGEVTMRACMHERVSCYVYEVYDKCLPVLGQKLSAKSLCLPSCSCQLRGDHVTTSHAACHHVTSSYKTQMLVLARLANARGVKCSRGDAPRVQRCTLSSNPSRVSVCLSVCKSGIHVCSANPHRCSLRKLCK